MVVECSLWSCGPPTDKKFEWQRILMELALEFMCTPACMAPITTSSGTQFIWHWDRCLPISSAWCGWAHGDGDFLLTSCHLLLVTMYGHISRTSWLLRLQLYVGCLWNWRWLNLLPFPGAWSLLLSRVRGAFSLLGRVEPSAFSAAWRLTVNEEKLINQSHFMMNNGNGLHE